MKKNNLNLLQGAPLLANSFYPAKGLSGNYRRYFSSNLNNLGLQPWCITGLVDAEGSFMVRIRKNSKYSTGWLVATVFSIALHEKDLPLLEAIQSYFGGIGTIAKSGTNIYKFKIESIKDIQNHIIPHFSQFPLLTQKGADFILFKCVVELMEAKKHLQIEGLNEIVSIKGSINKGLTKDLINAFPNISIVPRPLVQVTETPNSQWIAGFTSGEGCFKVNIYKRKSTKIGFGVTLVFQITQHSRDKHLLNCLVNFFGCGKLEKDSRKSVFNLSVWRFEDNYEKIIPFFKQNNIVGIKYLDFKDWCEIAEIVKSGEHLTSAGLSVIQKIRTKMNKGRKNSV